VSVPVAVTTTDKTEVVVSQTPEKTSDPVTPVNQENQENQENRQNQPIAV
jgi:hypothetical protein